MKKFVKVLMMVSLMLALCLCTSAALAETVTDLAGLKAALVNGGEVKLGANITLGNTSADGLSISAGKTVTLDLNGFTLSQTYTQTAGYQMILNNGTLIIKDSGNGGKISYTDSGNGGEYISDTIYNCGTLVIQSGTIENLSSATVASNGYPHAVDTYSGLRNTSVTINGGTIYCKEYSAIRMFCVSATNTADLIINGGTIKGAVDMQNGTKNAAKGSLTVNGGTFETTKNVNNIRFANWNGGATEYGLTANIKGGSFDGKFSTEKVPAGVDFDGFISGGSFVIDPDPEFIVPGEETVLINGRYYLGSNIPAAPSYSAPKTGDNSQLLLWAGLMIVAMMGMITLGKKRAAADR